jgi:hypothetical protein
MRMSLEAVAMIAVLATAPVPGSAASVLGSVTPETASPGGATVAQPRPAIPWVERYRTEVLRTRPALGLARRLVVGVGAAVAWKAADLPRHQNPGILPGDESRPGPIFAAPLIAGPEIAERPGGAIASLIARWSTLHPSNALEVDGMSPRGEAAAGTSQTRSRPCPAN